MKGIRVQVLEQQATKTHERKSGGYQIDEHILRESKSRESTAMQAQRGSADGDAIVVTESHERREGYS